MTTLAHGIGQSADLPLPLDLVLQAGAATVVVSFLIATSMRTESRGVASPPRRVPGVGWLRWPVLVLALYVVGDAFFGPPGAANPAPYALFVWLWVGLVPLSVIFGPVWGKVNPLRTLYRLLPLTPRSPPTVADRPAASPRWTLPTELPLAGPGDESAAYPPANPRSPLPAPGTRPAANSQPTLHTDSPIAGAGGPGGEFATSPPPDPHSPLPTEGLRSPRLPLAVLGVWPAAAGLLAFVWFELVAPHRADPLVIGCVVVGYGLVQLGFAVVYGEEWFAHGDFLEVYSTLAGRLSPLRRRHPLAGLAELPPSGAIAAFLAIWWGSTIFDSVSASPMWGGHSAGYATAALLLVCAVVFKAVRLLARRLDVTASLIPIAVGYTLAHYLSLVLVAGPHGVLLLVQQWGVARDASWGFTPAPGLVPILQITLILLGHVVGVMVAHDRALGTGPARPTLAAVADQLPVTLFMVACTWTGLFLLFVR